MVRTSFPLHVLSQAQINIPGQRELHNLLRSATPPASTIDSDRVARLPGDVKCDTHPIPVDPTVGQALRRTAIARHIDSDGNLRFWRITPADIANVSRNDRAGFIALCGVLAGGYARVKYTNSRHHPHRHYDHRMSAASALCVLFAGQRRPDGVASLLGTLPGVIINDLVPRVGFIFNRYRLSEALRGLVTDYSNKRVRAQHARTRDNERELQAHKTACAQAGSQILAAYLHHYAEDMFPNNSDAVVQSHQRKAQQASPNADKALIEVLSRAMAGVDGLRNEMMDIMEHVIAASPSTNNDENVTLLATMFFLAMKKYGTYVAEKDKNRKERWTTCLAFAFALGGLAPYAGPAVSIVGLITDKALQKLWREKDTTSLVISLISNFRSDGSALVKDRVIPAHGPIAAIAQSALFEQYLMNTYDSVKEVPYDSEHWRFGERVGRSIIRLPKSTITDAPETDVMHAFQAQVG